MLREFERRLADVLGAGLPDPLSGAVDVLPGVSQSRVLVSVAHAVPVENDFLSSRGEQVPGADASRRIVRLRCDVSLQVRQLANQGRDDQIRAFDAVLFFIDNPAFRSGRSLDAGDPDPGFFLHQLALRSCEPPAQLTLDAEGLFWPVGSPGQTGQPIERIRTRLVAEPLLLEPAAPLLVAGNPQVDLIVRLGSEGGMDVRDGGVDARPFGEVVLSLTDAGGRPGAGTLAGGVAGPGGSRRVPLSNGAASFQYTPPGEAGVDVLHVAFDNGEEGAGAEIGQLRLHVRGA
jgi:hypothetical protein